MSNTDPTNKRSAVLASYQTFVELLIQSSPVKILAVIEERKHLRKNVKDPLSFEMVNKIAYPNRRHMK